MEENQNNQNLTQGPQVREGSNVSFPSVNAPQKSSGPKTILIVGILILVGVLGFVVYKSATKKSDTSTEPTPFDNLTVPSQDNSGVQVSTPAPIATSTPSAANRTSVSVVVENGTGITGEAAYLQTQLKNLGYTDVKVSNAPSQGATTTTATFSNSVSTDIVSEITQKLNSIYQKVSTTTSSSATSDVVIVTGLRKGATPKPSSAPTTAATATPAASPTPTATPAY